MNDQSNSSESRKHTPEQLYLPDCSIRKTRRHRGKPLRRRSATPTLVIPDMPTDVVDILKALAKRRKTNYSALCKAILRDYAYSSRRPGRRR